MSIRWVRQTLTAILFVAAGILFVTNFFSTSANQDKQAQPVEAAPPPMFAAVHAARPVARGSVIRADDLQLQSSPIAPAKGTIQSIEQGADRIAIRDIAAAEPLSETNTAAAIEGTSLSEVIPPGLRAIALRVNEDSSVANLIKPGDRVDVLMVSNGTRSPAIPGRLFPQAEAVTILQNIPVLAVGGVTVVAGSNNNAAPARTVALAVTPKQAAMIALIRTVGTEYLSLRAGGDEVEVATAPVTTDDLQPNQPAASRPAVAAAAAAPAAPRPRTRTIEVIAGKSDNISRLSLTEGR